MITSRLNKESLRLITRTTELAAGDIIVWCPKNSDSMYYKTVTKQTPKGLKASYQFFRRVVTDTGRIYYKHKLNGVLQKFSYWLPKEQAREQLWT